MGIVAPKNGKLSSRRAKLAQQILRHIREHDLPKGHHLTEGSLASVFQVSRSPIRSALMLLSQHGVVEARPFHGFFLAKSAGRLGAIGIDVPPTKDEELYERVIDAHVSGRIGAVVNQVDLMRQFRAGRNVVERTLARLADEQLIERGAGQGWSFLPSLNTAEARLSGYQVRLALEPSGILLPQFRVDHDALERSRQAHLAYMSRAGKRRLMRSWRFEIDSSFHDMIAAFTGNMFWMETIRRQNRLRRLLEYRGYVSAKRVSEWCGEHLAIIDALEAGDWQGAAELMRRHLSQASLDVRGAGSAPSETGVRRLPPKPDEH